MAVFTRMARPPVLFRGCTKTYSDGAFGAVKAPPHPICALRPNEAVSAQGSGSVLCRDREAY